MSLFEPGATISRYTILGKLATGGMAEVYLARQSGPSGFSKLMVLKVILPHLSEDPEFVNLFHNEAKLAAVLNHPNVVQIFDFGVEGDTHYMAMEYLDGLGLNKISNALEERNQRIPIPIAIRIISDACSALEYAHSLTGPEGNPLDIIHRDVSPDNILVTYSGQVKLVDFGIAKARHLESYTSAGALRGKYRYMAPEMIRGDRLDRRVDTYAMGVVLFRLVTGQLPFDGDNHAQLIDRIVNHPAPRARDLQPDLPEALERIIQKSLNKDREHRYQRAADLQIDLEAFLLASGNAVMPYHITQFMNETFPAGSDEYRLQYQRLASSAASGPSSGARLSTTSATVEVHAIAEPTLTPDEPAQLTVRPEERPTIRLPEPSRMHEIFRSTLVEMAKAPGVRPEAPTTVTPMDLGHPFTGPIALHPTLKVKPGPSGTPASDDDELRTVASSSEDMQAVLASPTLGLEAAGPPRAGLSPAEPELIDTDDLVEIEEEPTPGFQEEESTPKEALPAGLGAVDSAPTDPTVEMPRPEGADGPRPAGDPTLRDMNLLEQVLKQVRSDMQTLPIGSLRASSVASRLEASQQTPRTTETEAADPVASMPRGEADIQTLPVAPAGVPVRRSRLLFVALGAILIFGGAGILYLLVFRDNVPGPSESPLPDRGVVRPILARDLHPGPKRPLVDARTPIAPLAMDQRPGPRLPLADARTPIRASAMDLRQPRDRASPDIAADLKSPDAAVRPVRAPDAAPSRKPPMPAAPARLSVTGPDGELFLDQRSLGPMPLKERDLPAGRYRLRLRSRKDGFTVTRIIVLRSGEHERVQLAPPAQGTIRILVRPWAKVVLDGKDLGTTPLPPVTVYEGSHTLTLENANLKVRKTVKVTVSGGQESTVKVRMDE